MLLFLLFHLLIHHHIIHLRHPLTKTISSIKYNLNPTQKFLTGYTPQQEKFAVTVGEKTATAIKKVRFLENLNKLFPKADEILDDQKIDIDDDNLSEIAIPNTQTMFKELNDAKLPEELNFFFGRN